MRATNHAYQAITRDPFAILRRLDGVRKGSNLLYFNSGGMTRDHVRCLATVVSCRLVPDAQESVLSIRGFDHEGFGLYGPERVIDDVEGMIKRPLMTKLKQTLDGPLGEALQNLPAAHGYPVAPTPRR